jgi:hypothetical protein
VRANLPPESVSWDVRADGLAVWLDRRHGNAVHYDLLNAQEVIEARAPDGLPAKDWPAVALPRLLFAAVPLAWEQLVENWRKDQEGEGHPPLVSRGLELNLLTPALPPATPRTLSALA